MIVWFWYLIVFGLFPDVFEFLLYVEHFVLWLDFAFLHSLQKKKLKILSFQKNQNLPADEVFAADFSI